MLLATQFPQTGFVRVHQIIQVIPISRSSWWRWVKEGKAPKGIKLGEKTTVWKAEDIHALLEELSQPDNEAA